MKKIFVLFFCLTTLLVFSSCRNSGGVMDKISKAMDGASSYEVDGVLDITGYYAGETMTVTATQKEIYSKNAGEELYSYSKSDIDITNRYGTTHSSVLEAFNEGEYFISYKLGEDSKRLRSEHTEKEFLNYRAKVSEFGNILSGYETFSSVKNEDGSYEVKLEKYDERTIRLLNSSYGFPLEKDGGEIEDIAVTIISDSNYYIKEITVDYLFSNVDFSGSEKMIFSSYGSAEKITDTINPRYYTSVDDATIVPLLTTLVNARVEEEQGSLAVSTFSKFSTLGVESTNSAETDASYGYEDEKYHFTAKTKTTTKTKTSPFVDGTKTEEKTTDTTYKDGMYTEDDTPRVASDSYARKFIKELIDPFSFSAYNVKSITKADNEDGTVTYTIGIDTATAGTLAALKELYSSVNAKFLSAKMTLEVVLKDYELTSIKYKIESEGQIVYNGSHYFGADITVTTHTVFED